eukprot:14077233-Ditylum_brightwellii.AAC.1
MREASKTRVLMAIKTIVLTIVLAVERREQNEYIDGDKDDSVEDSDDGGDKHLTHLTKSVDCCSKERSDPNGCVNDGRE